MQRVRFTVQGQVQGVGFRPFVFLAAEESGLTGFVRNTSEGVVVEVQGPAAAVETFARALEERLPPLASITRLTRENAAPLPKEAGFRIAESAAGQGHAVLISPDTTVCPDCLADMAEAGGRRFRYPFTNCTNCGPRYTITRSIPYDRPFTSMACFPLCPRCKEEYENPRDRRFHAQPNACPVCGPKVWFARAEDAPHASAPAFSPGGPPEGEEAFVRLAELLAKGGIAAIKGLGGFHLACDALNAESAARLRLLKNRPHKPFALMCPDLETARRIARISPAEEALLLSREHPIVLCEGLPEAVLPGISPDTRAVGIMLPYTPLHVVLLEQYAAVRKGSPCVLVMTSGNRGGEPICLGNREAVKDLTGIADGFLFHNRDILIRVDDSVVRALPGGETQFLRRARGFVPRPVLLEEEGAAAERTGSRPVVLGVGAELKNTLTLTKGNAAFTGQHIGDMSNLETAAFHREISDHLAALLQVKPELIVRDKHPNYLSTTLAEESGLPVLALQHHAAHAVAVLGENRHKGPALVWALDGTGLGDDGSLWGGELLLAEVEATDAPTEEGAESLFGDAAGPACRRVGTFEQLPLPGGDAAVREPWRIAHAWLYLHGAEMPMRSRPPEYADAARLVEQMAAKGINTPFSSSCGRLFDAAAALLGLCLHISYEGQAAIRLEEAQEASDLPPLPCPVREENGLFVVCTHALLRSLCGRENEAGGQEGESRAVIKGGMEQKAAAAGSGKRDDFTGAVPEHEGFLQARDDGGSASITDKRASPRAGVGDLAARFHSGLAAGLAEAAARAAAKYGVRHIGLSGGCMQNKTLAVLLPRLLREKGLIPLVHKALPPGDGCISFGQAVYGRAVLMSGKKSAASAEVSSQPVGGEGPAAEAVEG